MNMEIKLLEVNGFSGALLGLRLPFNSQEKADTKIMGRPIKYSYPFEGTMHDIEAPSRVAFGSKDVKLMTNLVRVGDDHSKFMRQIQAQFDITAPRYFIVELDTYKIGATKLSGSTMHTITNRHLTIDDFAVDLKNTDKLYFGMLNTIDNINSLIDDYKKALNAQHKTDILAEIKKLLPESFLQRFVFTASYQTLLRMIMQRSNHRLMEWRIFCKYIEVELPLMSEFVEARRNKGVAD